MEIVLVGLAWAGRGDLPPWLGFCGIMRGQIFS
jgi:hypothetical protein